MGIVDYNGFPSGIQINQHHQPIKLENLEIVEDHADTFFPNSGLIKVQWISKQQPRHGKAPP